MTGQDPLKQAQSAALGARTPANTSTLQRATVHHNEWSAANEASAKAIERDGSIETCSTGSRSGRRAGHNGETGGEEAAAESEEPPQAVVARASRPTASALDSSVDDRCEGPTTDRCGSVSTNANQGPETIDWRAVTEDARKAIRRGMRHWGPNGHHDPAPNGSSLADCIQQAVLYVLNERIPQSQKEASERVVARAQRVWKTYLETSLRQSRIRTDIAHVCKPTLVEQFNMAVDRSDAQGVFNALLTALKEHPIAEKVMVFLLNEDCGWHNNHRIKKDLDLTKVQVDSAKEIIEEKLNTIVGRSR
ncbi:MAG: hypothetical protein K2Y05_00910 [Hyphomicrobiaceae bacterium]|nr:hypothetical protein [Hyphomicrobiaceae bacterium]